MPWEPVEKASLRQRICQVSWGWFAISMSTGGIALLLHQTPHQFDGIQIIAKIVFIFNIVLFISLCTAMTIRFTTNPSDLKSSLQDPNESHFLPTTFLSVATIIMGIASFGTDSCGEWLQIALRIIFWIYAATAILLAIIHNWYLYSVQMAQRQQFALVRLLPSFPAMLCGTIASVLAPYQPASQAIPMLVGGITLQGFGFLYSLFIYIEYIYRLNKSGLPTPGERPEMFIAVGPVSFTATALIGMASAAVDKFPTYYIISAYDPLPSSGNTITTGDIALILAVMVAIFLWMMAFYFFCIAALSTLAAWGRLGIQTSWWSMLFPNTGFILATIKIGQAIQSNAVLWVASAMTILQVALYLYVLVVFLWGIWTRRLLWPVDLHEA